MRTVDAEPVAGQLSPDPNLSHKQGGLAKIKSYCRYYMKRPMQPSCSSICSGGGVYPPCTDLLWCLFKPFTEKDPDTFAEGSEE